MQRRRGGTVPPEGDEEHAFDLNIEKVLEHWPAAFALRELIANAIDEQVLTATSDPVIESFAPDSWRIRDFGRGLKYQHLTQKENSEKRRHHRAIGQFGIGLKDALAVCDRKRIRVLIRSRHCDIVTEQRPKAGFSDVRTLHAIVRAPSDPGLVGTEIDLAPVKAEDIDLAKSYFLRFSGDRVLEQTDYGDVLERASAGGPGRIYVKGLRVAEEPNFLFSYNLTTLNAPLRRALNRERTNVGRTAYSQLVKKVLRSSRSAAVADPLAAELRRYASGGIHDEVQWKDVALHACRVLQSLRNVIFVTAWQSGVAAVEHAIGDGYEPVMVPEDIATALGMMTDLNDAPMLNLSAYVEQWNASFSYTFVDRDLMTPGERKILDLAPAAARISGVDLARRGVTVEVSETMRMTPGTEVLGLWQPVDRRIIVRRDQLRSRRTFLGTFLHELTHCTSGAGDLTLEFETALTDRLGTITSAVVESPSLPL